MPHTDKEHPWIFSATFLADCRTSMAMPTRSERFTPRAGGARRARACSSSAWIPSMTRSEVNVAMLERFKRLPDWKKDLSPALEPERAACHANSWSQSTPPVPRPVSRGQFAGATPAGASESGRSSLSYGSTTQTTPPPRGRRGCFAGPAVGPGIGLGLSGSARRRGTRTVCSPAAFTGQFPDRQMVSRKTTREEEERVFETARA